MLTHELLVIVSGYPSSIDPAQLNHPSERQIFEKAKEFGALVAKVSLYCFKDHAPIVPTIQSVLDSYYARVVEIEAQIADLDLSFIMAETVDKWTRPMEFCDDLCASHKYIANKIVVKLRQDILSGFPKIAEIATQCLVAVDQHYIREITPWLLWGSLPRIDLEYPEFHECMKAIEDIGNCLRNVVAVHATTEFTELTRESHAAILGLHYPLEEAQLKTVLQSIKGNINGRLLPHVRAHSHADHLIKILGDIILCGSSTFCLCFAESQPSYPDFDDRVLEKALAQYYEDTQELDKECYDIATEIMSIHDTGEDGHAHTFGDILSGTNVEVDLHFDRKFSLFVSPTHGDVYGDIFYYLLCIWLISDSLKSYSPTTQRYKLFFNTIWLWFQQNINGMLKELDALFSGNLGPLDQIVEHHTILLKSLGKALLLNSRAYRICMKKILVAAGNPSEVPESDPINSLLDTMSEDGELSDLYIQLSGMRLAHDQSGIIERGSSEKDRSSNGFRRQSTSHELPHEFTADHETSGDITADAILDSYNASISSN